MQRIIFIVTLFFSALILSTDYSLTSPAYAAGENGECREDADCEDDPNLICVGYIGGRTQKMGKCEKRDFLKEGQKCRPAPDKEDQRGNNIGCGDGLFCNEKNICEKGNPGVGDKCGGGGIDYGECKGKDVVCKGEITGRNPKPGTCTKTACIAEGKKCRGDGTPKGQACCDGSFCNEDGKCDTSNDGHPGKGDKCEGGQTGTLGYGTCEDGLECKGAQKGLQPKPGKCSDPKDKKNDEDLPDPPKPPCEEFNKDGSCKSIVTAVGKLGTNPETFITRIFAVILSFSGGVAVLLIMKAGYQIMTSRGTPQSLQEGREQLVAAIVGLLFLIFSFVFLQVIGIDILNIPTG